MVNEDFDILNGDSHILCLKREYVKLNEPQNNLPFKDNHVPRAIISIGPHFQAQVPKWKERIKVRFHDIDANLKFLGIQLWPTPNVTENMKKFIGKYDHENSKIN